MKTDNEPVDEAAGVVDGAEPSAEAESQLTDDELAQAASAGDISPEEYAELKAQLEGVKPFLPIIEELRRQGHVSADDVRAGYELQQESVRIENEIAATFSQEHTAASQTYQTNIDSGMDSEYALKIYNAEMRAADADARSRRAEMQRALAEKSFQLRGRAGETPEQKAAELAAKYPMADKELLADLARVPNIDLEAKAKSLHDKAKQASDALKLAARRDKQRAEGSPEGAGGSPAATSQTPASPDPLKDPKAAEAWMNARIAESRAASRA